MLINPLEKLPKMAASLEAGDIKRYVDVIELIVEKYVEIDKGSSPHVLA